MAASFLLSKWYLDCVSREGRAFIGYAVSLRWGWLRLGATAAIEVDGDGGVRERTSLRGCSEPALDRESLRWTATGLGIAGRWTAPAPPAAGPGTRTLRLLESDAGRVDWTCLLPLASAEVEIGGRDPLRGLGYAERLDLTVKPWQLPIDELRWGRYLAAGDSAVWIEWRGQKPLRLLLHNGAMVDDAAISDAGLRFAGSELQLEDSCILREGRLGSTALRPLRLLRPLLPRRLLELHERKWLSRGRLSRSGRLASEGWAIHEVVRWR